MSMDNESLIRLVTENTERSKSNTHRIDKIETQQDSIARIATAVEVMATEQKHQTNDIREVKNDVAKLDAKVGSIEDRPAKRWNDIVEKVILMLIAAAVTYGLSKLGLPIS